jgi:hypothetical protein
MIKSEIDTAVDGVRKINKAGSKQPQFTDNPAERAAMTHKMNAARNIERMKDDPVWFKQHREDTKYAQWHDGMYVMLDDLEFAYELAVVENSLRDSVYAGEGFCEYYADDNCVGIRLNDADYDQSIFFTNDSTKLTRAQALYIATGDVDI